MPIIEIVLVFGLLAIAFLLRMIFAMLKAGKKSDEEREKYYAKRNCDYSQDR